MPLTIDISDAAIEKTETTHGLHLWGVWTSLFATNCIVCGKAPNRNRVRCRCGDGYYCDNGLRQLLLKDRPGLNHRRALVVHSEVPCLSLVWAEVKGSSLIIDHPSLDKYYKPRTGAAAPWVDLAVINPALDLERFHKIGHGIAMGFASITMDPRYSVDPSQRNTGLQDSHIPSHKLQWPGPLVFFCYGYDISDYVKLNPAHPGNSDRGAEADMTELDIWNELHELRWELNSPGERGTKAGPRGKPDGNRMVWKWKVKDVGTSMHILDVHHYDYSIIIDYFKGSTFNHIPSKLPGSTLAAEAVHVCDPSHPGHWWDDFWKTAPGNSLAEAFSPVREKSFLRREDDLRFTSITLPENPTLALLPMVGALAVGLRWMVKYTMDINPPFRGSLPDTPLHGRLRNLLWAAEFMTTTTKTTLTLRLPGPACDSVVVAPADRATPINPDHVRILLKYLNFTDPLDWSRRGPRGFEAYWNTHASVVMGTSPNALRGPGPYDADDRTREIRENIPEFATGYPSLNREVAHMTLEGLAGEDSDEERAGDIAKVRGMILKVIRLYRDGDTKFVVGRGLY
ncbi:hypothetical protein N658DRAFT_431937 [Parathielavia hyrcaniae]|uniref:Uncharacterized protein n=1 Tax=Parathielavia hyrcaniae TaxID=113614 RepID=A0AAN6PYR6_9PEZI|nr:hypothetical protein N658DRAFT_431937 [Parathielavia hyrcaniae]